MLHTHCHQISLQSVTSLLTQLCAVLSFAFFNFWQDDLKVAADYTSTENVCSFLSLGVLRHCAILPYITWSFNIAFDFVLSSFFPAVAALPTRTHILICLPASFQLSVILMHFSSEGAYFSNNDKILDFDHVCSCGYAYTLISPIVWKRREGRGTRWTGKGISSISWKPCIGLG